MKYLGQLKSPDTHPTGNNGNSQSDPTEQNGTHRTPEKNTPEHKATLEQNTAVIAVLEDQVAVLKSQLESERKEKGKLIDMLAMEQEKTKLLMLPQTEAAPTEKKKNWLGYFRRKR